MDRNVAFSDNDEKNVGFSDIDEKNVAFSDRKVILFHTRGASESFESVITTKLRGQTEEK